MSGGLWQTGDVITAERMNRKTIFIGTGNQIANLTTTYPGQLAFCTESGSGFEAGYFYVRNISNTAWNLIKIPLKKVIAPSPLGSEYITPSFYQASSEGGFNLIDSQTSDRGNWRNLYSAFPRGGQKYLYVSGTPWYQKYINKINFSLLRVGSPTGTLYCRARRVSNDSVIGTSIDTVNVANIPTSWTTYEFRFNPAIYMGEAIIFSLEYDGGNASNFVRYELSYYDPKANTNSVYYTSNTWYDATQDHVYWLYEPAYVGAKAVDDNLATFWESSNESNPWIIVDAGSLKFISGIRIYWLTDGRPSNYTISVSADASTWEDMLNLTTQPSANTWTEYAFNSRYCRYVRIRANQTLAMRIAEIDYYNSIIERVVAEHGHGDV